MKVNKEVDFHWSNYFKPTPVNLQYLVESIQAILATIAVTSFAMKNEVLSFWLLISAGILDKVARLFARAAKDYMETIKVEYPVELSDQVEVTKEIKKEGE